MGTPVACGAKMRRGVRLLLVVLAGGVLLWVVAGPCSSLAQAETKSQLSQKLESVRGELNEVRANLRKASEIRRAAQGDITALDQRIEGAEKELEKAEAARDKALEGLARIKEQLDRVIAELAKKEQELAETNGDLAAQRLVAEKRLVRIYKVGGTAGYLEAVLRSDSIDELFARARLLGDLMQQDNQVLGAIKALKARIEEQKQALEQERVRVSELQREQELATARLEKAVDEREASLKELEAARAAKEEVMAAAQREEAAWRAQEDQLLAESKRVAELLRAASVANPTKKGKGVLAWPVVGQVTSGFGYRIHPIFHVRKMHTGIDIDAEMGDPVKAAAAGTVVSAGWRGGYGKCVVVQHSGGLATLYAHLSVISVTAGDKVKLGQVLGKVGSTGYSTGPHLHFEVRVNGEAVDPLGYL